MAQYAADNSPQQPERARQDPQLRQVTAAIASFLAQNPRCTIVDYGCGEGALLSRLSSDKYFKDNPDLQYIAVDFATRKKPILHLAVDLELSEHIRFEPIEDALQSGCLNLGGEPCVVIIRNVFHELSIDETARAIAILSSSLNAYSSLIVQDLASLPVESMERESAPWRAEGLRVVMELSGFNVVSFEDSGKTANWFTMCCRRTSETLEYEDIRTTVVDARLEQWRQMSSSLTSTSQDGAEIANDIQAMALLRQLVEVGVLAIAEVNLRDDLGSGFATHVLDTAAESLSLGRRPALESPRHFRDRKNSQTSLENFLIGERRVTFITGPALMGKSDLVREVMSRRAHERWPLFLDCGEDGTVWSLLQQYLEQLGIQLNWSLFDKASDVKFSAVAVSVKKIVAKAAARSVVILDHCERMLDHDGAVADSECRLFLQLLLEEDSAKIVMTSRRSILPGFLKHPQHLDDQPRVPVGRLPAGDYVTNILDDFIDRANWNLKEYPVELIEAIDGHPCLATIAGSILSVEGKGALQDAGFHNALRKRLLQQLIQRLGRHTLSDDALAILFSLRRGLPLSALSTLLSTEEVQASVECGFIRKLTSFSGEEIYEPLSTLISAGRATWVPDDEAIDRAVAVRSVHKTLGELYLSLWRKTRHCEWLREHFFHAILSGDKSKLLESGVSQLPEIIQAGDYWFYKVRDFSAATTAFEFAFGLRPADLMLKQRLAACLMRVGELQRGVAMYEELLKVSASRRLTASFVDSLLFCHKYERALKILDERITDIGEDHWIASQYGRANMGVHRYKEAVHYFEQAAKFRPEDAIHRVRLGVALNRAGDRDESLYVLQGAKSEFPLDPLVLQEYAAALYRRERFAEAVELLRPIYEEYPRRGFILLRLVQCLCSTGEVEEAAVLASQRYGITEDRLKGPIAAEVCLARGDFERAINELGRIPKDDAALIGQARRIYLAWAQSVDDKDSRQDIVKRALDIEMSPELKTNVPLMVTTARVARLLDDDNKSFYGFLRVLRRASSAVADMIEAEGSVFTEVWEPDWLEARFTRETGSGGIGDLVDEAQA